MKSNTRTLRGCFSLVAIVFILASCRNPEADFKKAEQANTEQAFNEFIRNNPDSPLLLSAQQRLKKLQLSAEWQSISNRARLPDLTGFLQRNPESEYREAAVAMMAALEWEAVESSSNSLTMLTQFLAKYPSNARAREMLRQLEKIQYESLDLESEKSLRAFVTQFPQGEHAGAARGGLAELTWKRIADRRELDDFGAFLKEFPESRHAPEAKSWFDKENSAWEVVLVDSGICKLTEEHVLPEFKTNILAAVLDFTKRGTRGEAIFDARTVRVQFEVTNEASMSAVMLIRIDLKTKGHITGVIYSGNLTIGSTEYKSRIDGVEWAGQTKVHQMLGSVSSSGMLLHVTDGTTKTKWQHVPRIYETDFAKGYTIPWGNGGGLSFGSVLQLVYGNDKEAVDSVTSEGLHVVTYTHDSKSESEPINRVVSGALVFGTKSDRSDRLAAFTVETDTRLRLGFLFPTRGQKPNAVMVMGRRFPVPGADAGDRARLSQ